MTSPFTGGTATRRVKYETLVFRGESYTIKRFYFECDDTRKAFSNAEVDDMAMNEVYVQYRDRHGIPSPESLKKLRQKYGLSAHIMSKIAGIGINQYGLYENGEMPTLSTGNTLSSLFDRDVLLQLIDRARSRLGKDYSRTRAKVAEYIEPQIFILNKEYYSQFYETMGASGASTNYRIRKARWVTCAVK